MKDQRKLSELIELHLELKAKSGVQPEEDMPVPDWPEEEGLLPPRSTLFPSNRKKLTKIFYNTLLTIFFLLVAGLIAWGMQLH